MQVRALFVATLLALMIAPLAIAGEVGPERVENGTFDTPDAWALGYSWQILPAPGGLAFHNEGYTAPIEQATTALTAGTTYRASYTITGSAGSTNPMHQLRMRGPFGYANCPIQQGDGTFTCYLTAPAGVSSFQIRPGSGFGGVLDDVSIREILP